jgi:hypothetical protein
MPQDASTDAASFIRQIRGTSGEFASLLYLAAALRDRGKGSKPAGPLPEEHLQTINLLRTRIAELSRFSEKKMYRAAVKLNQIASALEGQEPAANVAQRLEPIRQLLQEQINHSRRSVQVGMQAVNDLDGLTGAAPVKSAAKSAPKTPPKKTATKARRATKASRPVAAKTPQKTATRKRTTGTAKTTAAEPGGGTSAGT